MLIGASWWRPRRRRGCLKVIGAYRMPEECPKAWLRGVGPHARRRELREAGRPPSARRRELNRWSCTRHQLARRRKFARSLTVTGRKGGGVVNAPMFTDTLKKVEVPLGP